MPFHRFGRKIHFLGNLVHRLPLKPAFLEYLTPLFRKYDYIFQSYYFFAQSSITAIIVSVKTHFFAGVIIMIQKKQPPTLVFSKIILTFAFHFTKNRSGRNKIRHWRDGRVVECGGLENR